jgi:hypothetical protein
MATVYFTASSMDGYRSSPTSLGGGSRLLPIGSEWSNARELDRLSQSARVGSDNPAVARYAGNFKCAHGENGGA